jgi:hypothetical protein
VRDEAEIRRLAALPVCGHQPGSGGLQFTIPLCRSHHRQLHQAGNEVAWWENLNINAIEIVGVAVETILIHLGH